MRTGVIPASVNVNPSFEALAAAYELPADAERWLRLNFVASADGAVTIDGRSGGLGGATDRRLMQVLRAAADVVVVGAGTVRAEGYAGVVPSAEGAEWRAANGRAPVPPLAIVSHDLALDPGLPVFTAASVKPMIITHSEASESQRAALADVADVLICSSEEDPGRVDLAIALDRLAERGYPRILCEGGPHLFGSLLDASLVDELCLSISPHLVGGDAGRIIRGATEKDHRFRLASTIQDADSFVFLRYLTDRQPATVGGTDSL